MSALDCPACRGYGEGPNGKGKCPKCGGHGRSLEVDAYLASVDEMLGQAEYLPPEAAKDFTTSLLDAAERAYLKAHGWKAYEVGVTPERPMWKDPLSNVGRDTNDAVNVQKMRSGS